VMPGSLKSDPSRIASLNDSRGTSIAALRGMGSRLARSFAARPSRLLLGPLFL
jgi:hypothetical protein